MAVDPKEVIVLYRQGALTMEEIGERFGVSRARIHQILREAGVETGYRHRPRQDRTKSRKAYAAYRLGPETRDKIDRLAEKLGVSRTRIVEAAVELAAESHGKLRAVLRALKEISRGQTERATAESDLFARAKGRGRKRTS